jgi:ElaB/YqjD/DUF883 family membrane-anchored ribosome-binding protein
MEWEKENDMDERNDLNSFEREEETRGGRFSPRRMMSGARDTIRSIPSHIDARSFDVVRDNAIPAAMIGLGLYLMFRDRDYRMEIDSDLATGTTRYSSEYEIDRGLGIDEGSQSGRAAALKSRMSAVGESISDTTRGVRDRVQSGTRRVRESRAWDVVESNPLVLGAAGAVVGAILGLAIPETERENRLMGEKRDALKERAMSMAEEGVARARQVVDDAKGAAVDALKEGIRTKS